MKCPKCNSAMESVVFEGFEVERCTNCKGIWFDMPEHEQLKGIKGSEAIDSGDTATGKEYNQIDNIDCPICHKRMIRMKDKKRPTIFYESCANCKGIFFDAGEFRDYEKDSVVDIFKDFLSEDNK